MNGRDAAAGAGCTFIGVTILLLSRRYGFATAANIGPGVFPTMAATVLCLCGVAIAVPAWGDAAARRTDDAGRRHWRAAVAVAAALVAFAVLIETAGFLVAAPALILLASRGDPQASIADVIGLAVLLTAASALIFVWSLGLPLPLLPLAGGN